MSNEKSTEQLADEKHTLESFLRVEVPGVSLVSGEDISYSPPFRVSVQKKSAEGVHFIIHADGISSTTLDFLVRGNQLTQLFDKPDVKDNKVEKWFFTFCGGHYCVEYGRLSNSYVVVEGSFGEARQKVVDVIGIAWGFQYPIVKLASQVERFGLREVDLHKIGKVLREGCED